MLEMKWPKTKQAAFNKVWKYFVDKGSPPSIGATGLCFYSHPTTGARCAVGVVLSKKDARRMPMGAIGKLPDVNVPEDLREFLSRLQTAHDETGSQDPKLFHSRFKEQLLEIAKDYGLRTPSL